MGGLFSGTTKTTSSSTANSGPSEFQAPYLTDAFNSAQDIYNNSKGSSAYTGDLYAGMTDEAKAALNASKGYASTTGLGTAQQLTDLGTSLSGFGAQAGSTLQDYLNLANGDATQANIAAASSYADNPYLNDQIDAVNRDIGRELSEVTLPGIDRAATGTGNLNSSRAGVASGIAQRGAADRMADNAASLRSAAYQNGLTLAQGDRAQQLNALSTAASAYQGLAGMGVNALNAGSTAGYNAFNQINQANALEQADQQGELDAAKQQWEDEDTRQSDLLARYMQIIGGQQWGTSATENSTGTSKNSGNLLGQIIGAGATAASFA